MIRVLLIALLLLATGAAHAQGNYGQSNPLVGVWQHSEPAGPNGPASSMQVKFLPDQTYETRWAISPTAQGSGSGIILVTGRWQLTGPNSYDSIADQALMCPAGMGCGPMPPGAPQLGIGQTMHFSFQMQNPAMMTVNGMSWYRQQ
jgi:hypothetical protein